MVFVDLDKFKQVNDGFGHQAGDAVLLTVAELLRDSLRDSDIVARYGGDEFVLLLPGVDAEQANRVGRARLRRGPHSGRPRRRTDGAWGSRCHWVS